MTLKPLANLRQEYLIVDEEWPSVLERYVNGRLAEGWRLRGGVVASANGYLQVLVRWVEVTE